MRKNRRAPGARYREYGTGEHVVVLIHGFLSSSHYWNRVTPGLVKAGYRVVTINLLGFGNADKPDDIEYSYEDYVEYVRKIIVEVQTSMPVVLVGHSMGGVIAARYAKLHSENVSALVLIHPPLYTSRSEAERTLKSTGRFYRYLLGSRYRNLGWRLLRSFLPTIIASHTPYSREQSMQNIILKTELIKDLEVITTETLLLIGLKDRAIYRANLASVELNPQVTVVKENVGHHSPITYPRLVQSHILHFIDGEH